MKQQDIGRLMESIQRALTDGNLDKAQEYCDQILVQDPQSPPANYFLAVIATRRGETDQAIRLLKKLLERMPNAFEALEWLANLYREQGAFEESISLSERMIRVRPQHPGGFAMLGLTYSDQGNPTKAIPPLRQAIKIAPQLSAFHFHLGRVLEQVVNLGEAESEYRKAVELSPEISMMHGALGKLLYATGRVEEGLGQLREAARVEQTPFNFVQLATALMEAGHYQESISASQKSLELDPQDSKAHELLGYNFQILGQFDIAENELLQSIKLGVDNTRPYLALLNGRKLSEGDGEILMKIEQLAGDSSLSREDQSQISYALGKAYTDLQRYQAAMEAYDRANELAFKSQLKSVPFDLASQQAWIDDVVKTFTPSFFAANRAVQNESDVPILIVGMIRSGTTLTDQILSSHPQIGSADEVQFWISPERLNLIQKIMRGRFPKEELAVTADEYLSLLQQIVPGKPRVIDKMPRNYLTLGAVHMLFPNARIIHCRRDPVDTCVSIYTTPFGKGAEFCFQRQSIVDAYREYERVMDHWRQVMPKDRFMEIDYEELVSARREGVMRNVVEFCGLPWDEAVMNHEKNSRSVNTPSLWQVRQPIYASSVNRSKLFQPWLREFESLTK